MEVTYIGNIVNGKKEGKGILITKNKSNGENISTFIGEFSDDKRNGVGLEKTQDRQLEGTFVDDKPEGKMAMYFDSRKFYVEYKNGIRNGREIQLVNDGVIITKEIKDDNFCDTFSIYSNGVFFTGKKLGEDGYQGVAYAAEDGIVDVGTFNRSFQLNGEGYHYRKGYSMYCTFNEGKYVPSKCYLCKDSGYISFGFCDEFGLLDGKDIITLIYSNNEYKGDLFINDYKNGEKVGKHEYYWGDGDYEKKWENGWGLRYFKGDDGKDRIMEGTFMDNGFPEGEGNFTYDGKKYSGTYKLNEQRCLFISDGGKAYRCKISHDARFNEATAKQFKTEVHN